MARDKYSRGRVLLISLEDEQELTLPFHLVDGPLVSHKFLTDSLNDLENVSSRGISALLLGL